MKLPSLARSAVSSVPGVQLRAPEGELPSASPTENVRFTLQVMAPNVAQGLFRRRPRAVAVATRLGTDGQAIGVIDGIRRAHGEGPVWVRVARDRMLLVLAREDVRRVLEGAPEPFAADPEAKRKGMSHFQPGALTISRGSEWRARRDLAESALESGRPQHRHAERFADVCREEAASLHGEVGWEAFNAMFWRITRRIVLGDGARGDVALTEDLWSMMDEANGLPGETSRASPSFERRIAAYIEAAEPGALAGLVAGTGADRGVRPERQLTHWLFALGDTAAANSFRALALLDAFPDPGPAPRDQWLRACLQEAMRLWPTTPLLSRETTAETDWRGVWVPKGTQILISNTFNHRDPRRDDADAFNPANWLGGGPGPGDWTLNHFSHGPQSCPGAQIAIEAGATVLDELTREGNPERLDGKLGPSGALPRSLDFFRLRFAAPTHVEIPTR